MTATLDTDVLLARYRRYRAVALDIQKALHQRVKRAALLDAADRLGLLEDGEIVFESEAEMTIFEDFVLLGYARHGRTVARAALSKSWPPPGSDHRMVLEAMAQSRYGIVRITALREGVGVEARDLLSGEDLFIVDIGMSRTARPGMVLAGRLLRYPEMWAWSGAAVPLPDVDQFVDTLLKMADQVRTSPGPLPPGDELMFAELLTALFVELGLAAGIEYRTA